MEKEDSFPQRVWQIVAAIPEGYVTTYGDVAKLAGSPRAARQVAGRMSCHWASHQARNSSSILIATAASAGAAGV